MPRKPTGNSVKARKLPRASGDRRAWLLVSSHGLVFLYIATHPDCTVAEICRALFLTRRSVWGLVGNLRNAEMVSVRTEGRRHHYTANLDVPSHHPAFVGKTMRDVLEALASQARAALANTQ